VGGGLQLGAAVRIATDILSERHENKPTEATKNAAKHLSKAVRVLIDTTGSSDDSTRIRYEDAFRSNTNDSHNLPASETTLPSTEHLRAKSVVNLDHLMHKFKQNDLTIKLQCLETFHTWLSTVENDQYSEKLVQFLIQSLSETHPKLIHASMKEILFVLQQQQQQQQYLIIREEDVEGLLSRFFHVMGDPTIKSKKPMRELSDSIKIQLREHYHTIALLGHVSRILQSPEFTSNIKMLIECISFLQDLIEILPKDSDSDKIRTSGT
jgi:hypothetical protein